MIMVDFCFIFSKFQPEGTILVPFQIIFESLDFYL